MLRIAWLVAVCGLAFTAAPAVAQDKKPAPGQRADPAERILAALAQQFALPDGVSPNEMLLAELLQLAAKKYDLPVVLNAEAFRTEGNANIADEKLRLAAADLRGLNTHQFLTLALDGLGATYLVRSGVIEVVPVRHAAKAARAPVDEQADEGGGRARLKEPLVCLIAKERPLNEAVAALAEVYDLNVVVAPQAGDARTGFVTARFLNVPADKALDLLAVQCDLRVVRKGGAYLLTSKDQANELFAEKLDRERQKIEVEKLRDAPAKPPAPPAP